MFDIATMNLEEINRRLFEIPKVELHCHLELAFRPSTLREWAIEDGLEVKSDEDFEREFLILEPMDDLPTVLNKALTDNTWKSGKGLLVGITMGFGLDLVEVEKISN